MYDSDMSFIVCKKPLDDTAVDSGCSNKRSANDNRRDRGQLTTETNPRAEFSLHDTGEEGEAHTTC